MSEEKQGGFKSYFKNLGPAVIVSMTIIGPGTMSSLVTAGSGWGFSFFWAVILSVIFAYIATWISTKLTCVTGLKPTDALKKHTWPWLAWLLVIMNFITQFCVLVAQGRGLKSAVTTLSQVSGGAGVNPTVALIITIALFGLVIAAYFLRGSVKFVQHLTSIVLTIMLLCFAITFFMVLPNLGDMLKGLIPSIPPRFEAHSTANYWSSISGIIGGAAGLYIYVYHGFALKDDKKDLSWMKKFGRSDCIFYTVIMFGLFSFFVFSVAATVLYNTGTAVTGVGGAAAALSPLLGKFAGYVFTIGWMGAVMTTSAGCAFFGLIPLLDMMGKSTSLKDKSTIIALSIYLIVPAVIIASFVSGNALTLLTKAMSLNNLVTPPGLLAFWYMTSSKKILGEHKNNWLSNVVIALMFVVVCYTAYNSAISIFTF